MEYENKTNEELIDLLNCKDEQIHNLEKDVQFGEESSEEIRDLSSQIEEHNEALTDRESVSEVAFYAGHAEGLKNTDVMRSWLNHKIEARL